MRTFPPWLAFLVLFLALLFTGAVISSSLVEMLDRPAASLEVWSYGRDTSRGLLSVYAMRMAAVFTLTTVTIARRTQIVSRWLTLAGLACALVLMVGIGISPWVELLFPLWILALSLDILVAGRRASSPEGPSRE